jgi:hypothetical protein
MPRAEIGKVESRHLRRGDRRAVRRIDRLRAGRERQDEPGDEERQCDEHESFHAQSESNPGAAG